MYLPLTLILFQIATTSHLVRSVFGLVGTMLSKFKADSMAAQSVILLVFLPVVQKADRLVGRRLSRVSALLRLLPTLILRRMSIGLSRPLPSRLANWLTRRLSRWLSRPLTSRLSCGLLSWLSSWLPCRLNAEQ